MDQISLTERERMTLYRVGEGYDVQHVDAVPLIHLGLITPVGPSAGSGYNFTNKGADLYDALNLERI